MKVSEEFKKAVKALTRSMIDAADDYAGRDEIASAAADIATDLLTGDFDDIARILAEMHGAAETETERADALEMMQQLNDVRKMYRSENGRQ